MVLTVNIKYREFSTDTEIFYRCHKSGCRLKDIFPECRARFWHFSRSEKQETHFLYLVGLDGRLQTTEYKMEALCFVVAAFPDDK